MKQTIFEHFLVDLSVISYFYKMPHYSRFISVDIAVNNKRIKEAIPTSPPTDVLSH